MGCSNSKASDSVTKQGSGTPLTGKEQDKKVAKEQNNEYQATMQFLGKVQLFKRLPKDQHPLLAGAVEPQEFKAGSVVIKQGDPGSEFFIIKSGEASVKVTTDGATKTVATLKPGDYFGENALLRDEPRAATISAETDLVTFKLGREKFCNLGLNEKLQFANRKAVGQGAGRTVQTKPPSPKTDAERVLIGEALRSNENLNTMVTLDDKRVKKLTDVAWKETVQKGQTIITEGDMIADYFYIVAEGLFEVLVPAEDGNSNSLEVVTTVRKGGSFGELALLYLVPRAATVKAKESSVVWVIDRTQFKNVLMQSEDSKIAEYIKYLGRVGVLECLLAEEKTAIAKALVEMHFQKGEVVLQQGEPGSTFYILFDGEVVVTKNDVEQVRMKATHDTCHFFGERALLNNEPRAATVAVVSETAKALVLDRDSFTMLLGPLADIIARGAPEKQARSSIKDDPSKAQMAKFTRKEGERIHRKDLQRVGLLGCGGFGAVELWEHRVTGETYAMKGLSKGYVVQTGMQQSVMNEKNILLMTNSPFIIRLYMTYNGSQTLYFLMEPALGGELYATYNKKGLHGSERHAKYYIAGTVFAFQHMHERRIIYRDLKPENLLLTELGHLKVTDMGLAKFVIGKTYTTCGTPDYFAPELIASSGHTNAVDWWTLGILLFELMSGHPPFESAYPMQIYSKVMKGINKVPFPVKCQGPVGELIKGLLKKEPSERLPMRPGGTRNIKEQKWYNDFDWGAMENGTMEAPYKPTVKSKKDICNFSARPQDMPKQVAYKDDGTGWDKDFAS